MSRRFCSFSLGFQLNLHGSPVCLSSCFSFYPCENFFCALFSQFSHPTVVSGCFMSTRLWIQQESNQTRILYMCVLLSDINVFRSDSLGYPVRFSVSGGTWLVLKMNYFMSGSDTSSTDDLTHHLKIAYLSKTATNLS